VAIEEYQALLVGGRRQGRALARQCSVAARSGMAEARPTPEAQLRHIEEFNPDWRDLAYGLI